MSVDIAGGQGRIAFLFPGQGSQYNGMGKDLYDSFGAARRVYDEAAKLLDFDLLSICFDPHCQTLSETRYCQPAIFVTSMAAFSVLKEHPKAPHYAACVAAGLSMGEATAFCAAGAMSFADAVRFVRDRGLFMDQASREHPGMMAAVLGLELGAVEAVCAATGAEVGNLNAPGQIVISGFRNKVEEAIEKLKAAGARRVIPLDVSGGFHSQCMDSACERIGKALEGIPICTPQIPVVSNLTAQVASEPDQIRTNLRKQMNHRTLWEDSMRFLLVQGVRRFVEFGPGSVLKGLMRKIDPQAETISLGTAEDFRVLESKTVVSV